MRYDAFISYRHAPLDMEIAKKIHSGLESFNVPKAVRKKSGKKNIKRVFRDQEELPIGSDLDNNIESALRESEYLIVICSPRTPESYWVCKEIETFIQMHDRQHVLAVLIEGEPDESFPKLLLEDENGEPVEPLAADVRGATKGERNKKLKSELMRLAAPLLGCSYDDLRQRHRERRIKRIAAFASITSLIVAILGISFAVYNAKMAKKIEENYELAVNNYELAVSNYQKSLANQYRYMADEANVLFEEGHREDAVLVALEALSDNKDDPNKPYVPQVEWALSNALYSYDTGNDLRKDDVLEHDFPVSDMKYDVDRCHLLTRDNNNTVYVWDVKKNELVQTIQPKDENGKPYDVLDYNKLGEKILIATNNHIIGYTLAGEEIFDTTVDECHKMFIDGKSGIVIGVSISKVQIIDTNTHSKTVTINCPEEVANYGNSIRYDSDNKKLYIEGSLDDKENSTILIYDLTGEDYDSFILPGDNISEFDILPNGSIISVSYNLSAVLEAGTGSYKEHVQMTDGSTGEIIWTYDELSSELDLSNSSYTKIRNRSYTDSLGEIHNEVVITNNSQVICFDEATGEVISNTHAPAAIRAIGLSASGPLAYLALSTGQIEIANLVTGNMMPDFAIDTDVSLMDMTSYDGIMAVRALYSPEVMLLKYHQGKDMLKLPKVDGPLYGRGYESADGKYLVMVSMTDTDYILNFTKADGSDTKAYNLTKNGFSSLVCAEFISDGSLLIVDYKGRIAIINPDDLSIKDIKLEADYISISDAVFSNNKDYLLLTSADEIWVIDTKAEKHIYTYKADNGIIRKAVINDDASKIYAVCDKQNMICINTKDNSVTPVCEDMYVNSDTKNMSVAISNNSKLLAVNCVDNVLRIVDLQTGKQVSEISFAGYKNSFFAFTEDGTKLVTQGDNYIVHIYDVASAKNLYTSDGQYNSILTLDEVKEKNLIVVTTSNEILVLSKDYYVPLAVIDGACLFTQNKKVVVKDSLGAYLFPFQTIDSLREDAKIQFGDAKLSEEKMIKYHINGVN